MFELPVGLLIIACLTITFSSLIQTAIGFGLALIAVPILLLIDPAMVPAPVVMVAFAQLVVSSWLHRADIQWPLVRTALIGRLPGTVVAMGLMSYFGDTGLKLFIAISVLAAVVLSLFKFHIVPNKKNHLIAGFFSGITGTTSGIGGPPIALLYQHQHGDFVRANMSAYFVIGSVISLSGMGMVGYVTTTSWLYAALFLPSTFIGVWLGLRLKKHLKPQFMRPAILVLCGSSAMAVIVSTLV
jgi:uncharacterized membrane protein YfcA